MILVRVLLILAALVASVLCVCQAVYLGWVSATPLKPDDLARVQSGYLFWLILSISLFVLIIVQIIALVRKLTKGKSRTGQSR